MRLTVLGGRGAYPTASQACSGYLIEHAGFTLLIDPGYATMLALLEVMDPMQLDAVIVSHGHPDHCADLNPLLRCRALRDDPAAPLPTYSLPRALDAVLALDRPGMLDDAVDIHEFSAGTPFRIGPFEVETRALPHFVPNAGMRIAAGGRLLAYTGDTGPCDELDGLARDADLLLADASYAETVPDDTAPYLWSAALAAATAQRAGARRLILTHVMPETPEDAALARARREFDGEVDVARPGLVVDLA